MKRLIGILLLCLAFSFHSYSQQFKFAFLTDMHIHSDSTLKQVDQLLSRIDPDVSLIVTGGDNVDIDNLSAEQLPLGKQRYQAMKDLFDKTNKDVYFTIGNHDRLPSALRSNGNAFEVFESNFGKTYYSFEHKGWKFIVLNSVETKNNNYAISDTQLAWLSKELSSTPADQPLVVISHVPFLSVYYAVLEGKYTAADTFSNQKEVMDMFQNHNLKLVLQGHMHLYEEIKVKGVEYITAGAVSGNWWGGAYHGTEPGYLEVQINNQDITWTYKK